MRLCGIATMPKKFLNVVLDLYETFFMRIARQTGMALEPLEVRGVLFIISIISLYPRMNSEGRVGQGASRAERCG